MLNQIKRYKVQSPLLRDYIRFFWELRIDHAQLNHKLLPQRNINIRINLSDAPHSVVQSNQKKMLEDVYFLGLQSQFIDAHLEFSGKVKIMGICFQPDGVYPFLKIPLSEFRNQILGADEIGFKKAKKIINKLKETNKTIDRLKILEYELIELLDDSFKTPDDFRLIFKSFWQDNSLSIAEFCRQNKIATRQMERKFNKYVGLSASSYNTLKRFHGSLNQLLSSGYSKMSDVAYTNEYFDQMHFIKEFKRFTGETPKNFVNQKNSILHIGKLT